jgi:ketosteroid isomerase-like protein
VPNAETVTANSRAFGRRDIDAMLEFYAPDAVVTDRRAVGWGPFRGRDEVRDYYEGIFDNVSELHEDFRVVSDEGDVIVADCHLRARLVDPPDSDEVEFRYALRIALANGLITAMDIYENVAAAAADP